MSMHFIEFPVYVANEIYLEKIQQMADHLMKTGLVHSVFQVGGVSHPGISDIDLYVVFKDGKHYHENPVQPLKFPDNYLFSHKLFGTCLSHARELEQFTFFGKYHHIAGEQIDMFNYQLNDSETMLLKSQIALEYLIKAWIAINIGITYNSIKLRSFLLHAKGILLDINFLNLKNKALEDCILRIIQIRDNWFQHQPTESELLKLVMTYRDQINISITDSLNTFKFHLPHGSSKLISKNISLVNGNSLKFERKGLPPFLSFTGKSKLITKLINRFNHFYVNLPMNENEIPEVIERRFHAIKAAFEYNQDHLPAFICTGHGMNIFQNK